MSHDARGKPQQPMFMPQRVRIDAFLDNPPPPVDRVLVERMERVKVRFPPPWPRSIRHDYGWYPLVLDLADALAKVDPSYEVHQIKEKLGELRFYAEPSRDASDEQKAEFKRLISEATRRSWHICERCGSPGGDLAQFRVNVGPLKTLCRACAKLGGFSYEGVEWWTEVRR